MVTRKQSERWFERAQRSLVEGVNSPSRGAAVYSPSPLFLERGQGAHVWDADGNGYIDFMMSFGALIQGHAHPKIVEVVSRAVTEGTHFAAATSAEVEAAERLRRMVPSAEVVRFTNSGSEATMLALRLARAHTGRTKFLKFEGHYHGWYDPYLLNAHSHSPEQLGTLEKPARIPDSQGIPPSTFDDVVLVPWNDTAWARIGRGNYRTDHGEHGMHLAERWLSAAPSRSHSRIRSTADSR
jgi:glutamate-1-semialdehyde 2,1-aminomutase